MKKQCLSCHKIFNVLPYRRQTARYCSSKCQHKGLVGTKQSEATRRKKSRTLKKAYASGRRIAWNFQGFKIVEGYKFIKKPSHPFADGRGYIGEHRLKMEEKLGRFLKPRFLKGKLQKDFELVHHLNGNRLDNRISNLQLLTGNSHHYGHETICPKCNHKFTL